MWRRHALCAFYFCDNGFIILRIAMVLSSQLFGCRKRDCLFALDAHWTLDENQCRRRELEVLSWCGALQEQLRGSISQILWIQLDCCKQNNLFFFQLMPCLVSGIHCSCITSCGFSDASRFCDECSFGPAEAECHSQSFCVWVFDSEGSLVQESRQSLKFPCFVSLFATNSTADSSFLPCHLPSAKDFVQQQESLCQESSSTFQKHWDSEMTPILGSKATPLKRWDQR